MITSKLLWDFPRFLHLINTLITSDNVAQEYAMFKNNTSTMAGKLYRLYIKQHMIISTSKLKIL